MEPVIGIDLGTTNSCVAIVDQNGSPRVIPNKGGNQTTPSIVAITDNGKRLVGQLAKRQAVINAKHTIHAAKRLIGRRFSDEEVQRAVKTSPYDIVEGPHGDARIKLRDEEHAVPEISSMILQELRQVAQESLGEPVSKAVITVPAYFNDNQRQATKDAGRIAGLDVLRIINEPTAAALAYGFGKEYSKKIAVYDLGGGTFDISILDIGQGVFEVITTAGDTFLGGEDFDECIIEWLVFGFAKENKVDLRQDSMALQRLKEAAENAKIELSSLEEAEINLPFIYSTPEGTTLHLQRVISRAKIEELGIDLIERSNHICAETLEKANIARHEIDDVILVGGMTRMPKIQEAVQSFFNKQPSKNVHPDEVVALGAAIQGRLLLEGDSDTLLLDVTPHNLGIMVANGMFEIIIPKDTTIPTSAKKVFTTVRDNQTQVRIVVMQGESKQASENELLGEFVLTGLQEAQKGEVRVEVNFEISADGIVGASAKDLESGRVQNITVTASSGLTEDEIAKMAQENQDFLVQAENTQAFEETKTEVERYLRELEKLAPQVESSLDATAFGSDAMKKAKQTMGRAQDAIKAKDIDSLSSTIEPLKRTLELFKKISS